MDWVRVANRDASGHHRCAIIAVDFKVPIIHIVTAKYVYLFP